MRSTPQLGTLFSWYEGAPMRYVTLLEHKLGWRSPEAISC
jgi:hypothetical protein